MQMQSPHAHRQRAPAMNAELRRAAIVAYTLPLLTEHGPNVTTSQIATAAGIAEGTVFRVFKDKRELLLTCLHTALDTETEANLIEAVDRALPLAQRLTKAIGYANDYQARLWAVAQALQAAGIDPRDAAPDHKDREPGPPAGFTRVSWAIAGLIDPATDPVRIDPELAARMLLGLAFAGRMQRAGLSATISEPAEIVDLFLHGILRATKEDND
jgi:AcrR family transcriptional regulator